MSWRHERSKACIHESNAIAERQARSVTEGTRTNLLQAGVSHVYWPYALEHTCTAFNISHVNGDEYTPWFKSVGVKFPGDLIPLVVELTIGLAPKRGERTVSDSLWPQNPVCSWAIGISQG